MEDDSAASLPLFAETMTVKRRKRVTGKVRVQVSPREHEELVDVPLKDHRATVERVPVGRFIDEVPPVRVDGDTTIIPVVEERAVVTVRLFLREEVHMRVVQETRVAQRAVTLRSDEVEVHREPVNDPEYLEGNSHDE